MPWCGWFSYYCLHKLNEQYLIYIGVSGSAYLVHCIVDRYSFYSHSDFIYGGYKVSASLSSGLLDLV